MKTARQKITVVLTIFGIVLIALSVIALVGLRINQQRAEKNTQDTLSKLYDLMPQISDGVWEDGTNTEMPMLELDGKNYVGIVEIPSYQVALPVLAQWDTLEILENPCLYTGSIYDGSIIIGGSDNKGQFDFMKIISENDIAYFTDLTGQRFRYTVQSVEISKDVSTENLQSEKADLVLFAKNTYSLDYTIVRCVRK